MALIPEYHVVADMYPVDPQTNPSIFMGMFVEMDSSGYAIKAKGDSASSWALGVAGDSTDTSDDHTPYSADIVIGAVVDIDHPRTRPTTNRVSDFYNETGASGKLTVYTTGGRFATDQYETSDDFNFGSKCYVSRANDGLLSVDVSTSKQVVGLCVVEPGPYDSGVPGTQMGAAGDQGPSMSLGNYVVFNLVNFYQV